MNRLLAVPLALALVAACGTANAQSYPSYGATSSSDYARVVRVDPVFDSYANGNGNGQRCYERTTTVGDDGYYGRDDDYRRDDYGDPYGTSRPGGTQTGRTVATVVGGIVGAAVGSQIGGGSARYATSAIGSMVGGMAGRQVYDANHRQRVGTVRVCDPVYGDDDYYRDERSVNAYDVTYEYAGRTYTTRTDHHPGDRIRVRVDVRPE